MSWIIEFDADENDEQAYRRCPAFDSGEDGCRITRACHCPGLGRDDCPMRPISSPKMRGDQNRRLGYYEGMLAVIGMRSDVPQELRDKIQTALFPPPRKDRP